MSKRVLLVLTAFLATHFCQAAGSTLLNGAGATFPYPLYSKWFSEFQKVKPGVEINYQSIGSGAGIKQFLDKTIDFGASDAPMTDEQLAKAQPAALHIPTALGAVVVTYNLPGLSKPLQFSGDVLADIFLGKISKWDDARIAKDNAGVKLPAGLAIMVAHRSDGSGTTAVFTDYLSKVSADWKSKVGSGTAIKWPAGLGGKGNEGVTGLVKQTPGAIAYVELIYAEANKLPSALLKNRAGVYVAASPRTVTAAAQGSLKGMPKDFRVSITQAEGKDAYPISSFTYLLAYSKMEAGKGRAFKEFLAWALDKGQPLAEGLSYASLPKSMIGPIKAKVAQIQAE